MAPQRSSAFRPDLEGLRGLAILLVLAFHAGVPGVGGGFIGVDVFFVLSGFLITGLLLRERATSGHISLPAFYARRARRILPAALVVLAATLVASALVLSPLDLVRVAGDAVASALSVGNIRFALAATDYFTPQGTTSPLLHYWSLGVEEQFYLLWPALLILATRWRRPILGAGSVLAATLIVSFAASLVLTGLDAGWAFYSLPTRAWQLALGGLLALLWPRIERLPDRLAVPIGWAGLGAVLVGGIAIDPNAAYPGLVALAPTLGTGGLILAGTRRGSPGDLLAVRPMRFLGRISYSLYLVHWPLLVLPAAGLPLGENLPLGERLGLALIAIPIAAACQRWVEEPIHRGRRIRLPAGRTVATGLSAMLVMALLAVGTGLGAELTVEGYGGPSVPAALTGDLPSDLWTPAPTVEPPTPAASETSAPAPPASPTKQTDPPTSTPRTPVPIRTPPPPSGPQPLPTGVRPALSEAEDDIDVIERNGCAVDNPGIEPTNCVYGDPHGRVTVALVGDSHATQWFPAVQKIALARHWRLLPFTKLSCRFVDLPQYSRILKREYTECETWRKLVVERLQQIKPDLVIVSVAGGMEPTTAADGDPTRQGQGLARLLDQVPGPQVIIVDTPQSQFDVPACIAGHVADVRPCETSRSVAFYHHWTLERTAASLTGATLVDLSGAICSGDPCPVVLDRIIVYRDSFHLTATFAAALAARLEAQLPKVGGS